MNDTVPIRPLPRYSTKDGGGIKKMQLKGYIASIGAAICLAASCPLPGSAQQPTLPTASAPQLQQPAPGATSALQQQQPSPGAAPLDQSSLSRFQIIQSIGIIVAIIFTLYQFQRLRHDIRQSRFLEVGRWYNEFLKQSVSNERAPTCYDPSLVQHFISSGGTKAEILLYDMLFATCETAYLLYQNSPKKDRGQWEGWELWMRAYFQNNIRCSLAWDIAGRYYDPAYVKYVTGRFTGADARALRSFPEDVKGWANLPVSIDKSGLKIGGFQVMQYWEGPIMKAMANIAAIRSGMVLEVGFGLGILSGFIQEHGVASHTILEAHPDVYSRLLIWSNKKPNVVPVLASWETWVDSVQDASFDAIFFDTYPLRRSVLHKNHFSFFKEAHRLLKDGGLFTYYTDEARHVCAEHQEMLLKYFAEFSVQAVRVQPPDDCEYWKAETMLVVVAKKTTMHYAPV